MAKRMAKRLNTRKPAKRKRAARKPERVSFSLQLKSFWLSIRYFVAAVVFVAVIGSGLILSYEAINKPLQSVQLKADFVRVNSLDVEKVLNTYKTEKFLSVDLEQLRIDLGGVNWVDRVEVQRRFPASVEVTLIEHVAAARWGETGLLNTRGEVILRNARYLPPELPRLDGPDGSEWQVAQQYLNLRQDVLDYGMNIDEMIMDARGAWRFTLAHGLQVRIGREATDQRFQRFSRQVLPVLLQLPQNAGVIDMRYNNGFAVKWRELEEDAVPDASQVDEHSSMHMMKKIIYSEHMQDTLIALTLGERADV